MLRLDLVVGPDGAGKSTFVRSTLSWALPPGVPLVNADEIAAERWPESQAEHAYDAARFAAATRAALIEARQPFIAETVFSHPSKLDLIDAAQAAGYSVRLHVVLVPVELSVQRVAHRLEAGGHAVPAAKVRHRHARSGRWWRRRRRVPMRRRSTTTPATRVRASLPDWHTACRSGWSGGRSGPTPR